MSYLVGAYASAPTAEPARTYLEQVARLPGFGGFEVPCAGDVGEAETLASAVAGSSDLVLTTIGPTVARNAADPWFGLASPAPEGRRAAVELVCGVAAVARRLNDRAGRRAVTAVELHSAPSRHGRADSLSASLEEVAAQDWDGALLTVEHCDAATDAHPAQKGYLTLAEEIEVVRHAPGGFAVTINWGRSAIDGRSAAAAADQIAQAREAGVLGGLMFSGVADVPSAYGPAWSDAHLPPSTGGDPDFADLRATEPRSLLGPRELAQALSAAGDRQRFTGLKIAVRPTGLPVSDRLAYVADGLRMLDRVSERTAAMPAP